MELGVLLRTLLQLYAMLLLGFGLCKLGTLDGHVNRSLSALVVSVTYPAKLLWSMLGQPGDRREAIFLLLGGMGIYLCMLAIAMLSSRLLHVPEDESLICVLPVGKPADEMKLVRKKPFEMRAKFV